MIAVTHPGKIGDALYTLPTAKLLANKHKCKIDFYTSRHCEPMEKLVRRQDYINDFIIPQEYEIKSYGCGVQPWDMTSFIKDDKYGQIYNLGFKNTPDCSLLHYCAKQAGFDYEPIIEYDFDKNESRFNEEYIILASRRPSIYDEIFLEFIEKSPYLVVQIGSDGEFLGNNKKSIDLTKLDMLECLPLLKHAKCYIGLMSSLLVLANGFNIPKLIPHNNVNWDMRHVVNTNNHFYMINPTVDELLYLSDFKYSNILNVDNYYFSEAQHIANMENVLQSRANYRMEHIHRRWEYGLGIRFLRENNCKTVLDVGGGGSLFAPSAEWLDISVTQVDPGNSEHLVSSANKLLNKEMVYHKINFEDYHSNELYDAITCISVIEHVENDIEFFTRLLDFVKPGGLLYLTTDFHPSGKQQCAGHIRTYNDDSINRLIEIASLKGFRHYNGFNYDYKGEKVNNYTFASIALIRDR